MPVLAGFPVIGHAGAVKQEALPVEERTAHKPLAGTFPRTPGRLTLIVLLGSLSAFGPLSFDTYLPALPDLQAEFGVSTALSQATLSACLLGMASGQLVAGTMSDRFGRRRPLRLGLLVYALTSMICAVAPSIWVLILARYLQGVAGGSGVVIARATVRDLHEGTEAARFFSRLLLVTGLAPILAPILGGQLLRVTDWRGIFALLALIGTALLIAATLLLPETLHHDHRHQGGLPQMLATFRMLLSDRVFVGFTLIMGCTGAALFAYIASSPFVLQEIYDLSPQQFSLVFGSIAVGYIASSQVNARMVGRKPLHTLLHRGLLVFALCGTALLVTTVVEAPLVLVLIPLYAMMWTMGFIFPNSTALALTSYPRAAGSASALLGLAQFAAGALAAPLVGIGGEDTAIPMGVIIAVASAAAFAAFGKLSRGSHG